MKFYDSDAVSSSQLWSVPRFDPVSFRMRKTGGTADDGDADLPQTDNTGRPLEATIIGRNATSITVIRKSDGARFEIPYNRLSEANQAFVVTLAPPCGILSRPS